MKVEMVGRTMECYTVIETHLKLKVFVLWVYNRRGVYVVSLMLYD